MKNQTQRQPTPAKFPLLRQLCNLVPNHLVPQLAREHAVEEKHRTFRPGSHVVSLIHAQLTHALGSRTYATPCGCTRVRCRPFAAQPRPARTPSRTPIADATPGWPLVPHPHSNVEGFDFHGENLTTDKHG